MDGRGRVEGWGDDEEEAENADDEETEGEAGARSREGRWECGRGRCAVTGRRVLGGTAGLRRVVV